MDVPDLAAAAARWPDVAAVAARAGVASVHAVPLRLRDDVVGALNLFGSATGSLDEADLRLAQALAGVATLALVQDRAAADMDLVDEQLQGALDSRVVLEQAKGVLSDSGQLDMAAAHAAPRSYARDHDPEITELAPVRSSAGPSLLRSSSSTPRPAGRARAEVRTRPAPLHTRRRQ